MSERLINELRSIELFAEDLRQKCYRARKKLERFYASAKPANPKRHLPEAEVARIIANRKKTILRKLK